MNQSQLFDFLNVTTALGRQMFVQGAITLSFNLVDNFSFRHLHSLFKLSLFILQFDHLHIYLTGPLIKQLKFVSICNLQVFYNLFVLLFKRFLMQIVFV